MKKVKKMKNASKVGAILSICLLTAFVIWTVLVVSVDVQPIGVRESEVGFATFNGYIHGLTGTNMTLYTVTDWLGLVPIFTAIGFAVLGLAQWIKRKSILQVDKSIFLLGAFYIAVIAVYILFELWVVNYRPVLIDGAMEASYPSSTTLLVCCVIPTAVMQLNARIKNKALRIAVTVSLLLFTAFMVAVRFISGVHWTTDIVGGILLSGGLVTAYYAVFNECV